MSSVSIKNNPSFLKLSNNQVANICFSVAKNLLKNPSEDLMVLFIQKLFSQKLKKIRNSWQIQ